MKKKITFILVLAMVFVLMFSFIACDKESTDENVDENQGQTVEEDKEQGDDEQGEEEQEEEISTAIANSQLLKEAFSGLLASDHVSVKADNFKFELQDSLFSKANLYVEGNASASLRKAGNNYDCVASIDLYVNEIEQDEEIGVVENRMLFALEFSYIDAYMYLVSKNVYQVVIDGKGYSGESDYLSDPDTCDAAVIEGLMDDLDSIDAYFGNESEESRVNVMVSVGKANTLDGILGYAAKQTGLISALGYDKAEAVFATVGRLLSSAAELASGETEADADGNRTLGASIELADFYNNFVSTLNANLDKKFGEFIDLLLEKDAGYAGEVIDRLFPEGGLTIKAFIAETEEILAENGIEISFKEIVDEVQSISGLSTQQIADVLNPLLAEMLPDGVGIAIEPEEGETLYDTLQNTVFRLVNTDTIINLIASGLTEREEIVTSAVVNEMAKGILYGEGENTVADLLQNFEIASMLVMIRLNEATVDLSAAFDNENRLSEFAVDVVADIKAILPDESGEEMPDLGMTIKAEAKLTFDYSAKDEVFDTSDYVVYEKEYNYGKPFEVNDNIELTEILEAIGVVDSDGDAAIEGVKGIDENGYILSVNNYWVFSGDNIFMITDDNADLDVLVEIKCNNEYYFVKIIEGEATQSE